MVKNENRNFSYMTRRIGGTTYKVKVVFNDTGHETMEDKILRIVRNEALDNDRKCDIMDVPQMSRWLIPQAYRDRILSSMPSALRSYLLIIFGS